MSACLPFPTLSSHFLCGRVTERSPSPPGLLPAALFPSQPWMGPRPTSASSMSSGEVEKGQSWPSLHALWHLWNLSVSLSLLLSSVARNCTWNIFFSFSTPQTLQVLLHCPAQLSRVSSGPENKWGGKIGAMLDFFHSINW